MMIHRFTRICHLTVRPEITIHGTTGQRPAVCDPQRDTQKTLVMRSMWEKAFTERIVRRETKL
ncbi:hypothetical protein JCM14469_20020 [Desulfatiferula olefinivorans]